MILFTEETKDDVLQEALSEGDQLIQKILSDTGSWYVDWDGIRRISARGKLEFACPHLIFPIGRLVDAETGAMKTKLSYRRKGQPWQTTIVERNVLASSRSIIALADLGVAVTSNSAPLLVEFLNEVQERHYFEIEELVCIGRMGYIPKLGFIPYVKEVLFAGELCFNTIYQSIREEGTYHAWLKTALECRNMSVEARIMLAAAFASPLVSIVGALPFFVHTWSVDSGTGKTVALMLAASVWADPELGKYIQTFNGTQVGQERTAAFLNNLPFLIDELQLANNGKGSANVDVYQLAQGTGRLRGKRTGGVEKTPTWSNIIISTGEMPIVSNTAGAGALNRTLDIEAKPGCYVVSDGHRISNELRNNFGFAGKMFVEKVFSSADSVEAVCKQYRDNYDMLVKMNTTDKQAMAAAVLITADQLTTEWLFKDNKKLTAEEMLPYLISKADVSAGKRAYDWLCGWVVSNLNHFYRDTQIPMGATFGVIEGDVVFVIRQHFDQALKNAGFSPKSTLSYLRAKNLIIVRENKGFTKAKRIDGISTDCVWLICKSDTQNDGNEVGM